VQLEIAQLDEHYVTGLEALGHLFAGVATQALTASVPG
jgi:hypothetical protein